MSSAEQSATAPGAAPSVVESPVLAPAGGPFSRASVWKKDVSRAPTAANSEVLVTGLAEQVRTHYGTAAFNVWQYNASFYSVPPAQPGTTVRFDDCQGKGAVPDGLFGKGGQFEDVPIPADAVPAMGTDAHLTVYQASTDRMWDFWVARKKGASWSACWGGRMDDVSRNPGYFFGGFGSTASCLAHIGGAVGIREAQLGRIDHALALAVVDEAMWDNFSWPAQRADGSGTAPSDIPLGTRFRLDPSVDVDSLHLHPLAAMVARAAQRYGFITTDRAGAVAVITESGEPVRRDIGVNPWKAMLGDTPDYHVMQNFPWDRLEALPRDYGKPADAPR